MAVFDGITDLVGSDANPMTTTADSVGDLLGMFWNIFFGIGIAGSAIAIILSGIKFVTSRGDPKAFESARRYLVYSIIGFVLTIGAFTIYFIINTLIGGEESPLTPIT